MKKIKKTKNNIINSLMNKMPELSKSDVSDAIDIFFETVKEELINQNRVELRGFGTFAIRKRLVPSDPRKNLGKGNSNRIECSSIYFRPSKNIVNKINNLEE